MEVMFTVVKQKIKGKSVRYDTIEKKKIKIVIKGMAVLRKQKGCQQRNSLFPRFKNLNRKTKGGKYFSYKFVLI